MRISNILIAMTVGAAMFMFIGCRGAQPPTTADVMRGHAADVQAEVELKNKLADDWERGAMQVRDGREQIREGRIKVQEGTEQIQQGKRDIAEGNQLIQESERRFRQNFPGLKLPGGLQAPTPATSSSR